MGSPLFLAASSIITNELGQVLLLQENYGRRRFGFPGGQVELGESPHEAAIREAWEETGARVAVDCLIGLYRFTGAADFCAFVFRAQMIGGELALPASGEIAEIGWFGAAQLPSPLTHVAPHALRDFQAGRRGVMKNVELSD